MRILDLIDLRKMCWPSYLYFFTYVVTQVFLSSYYYKYKKQRCIDVKVMDETIETCMLDCTTFNYLHNFMIAIIFTFVLNILCKYGSYVGTFIAILIFLFSLTPLWYIIKILMDKSAKVKDLKC
jgi:hypothetical protein